MTGQPYELVITAEGVVTTGDQDEPDTEEEES